MIDKETTLTLKQAYTAMYKFLDHEYKMTGSDEIGGMLGGMSMLEDGNTADPAAWFDWLRAVENVLLGDDDIKLHIKGPDYPV